VVFGKSKSALFSLPQKPVAEGSNSKTPFFLDSDRQNWRKRIKNAVIEQDSGINWKSRLLAVLT